MASHPHPHTPAYHVIRMLVSSDESDITMGKLYDLGCLGLEEKETELGPELKAYFAGDRPLIELREEFLKTLPSILWVEATTIGLSEMTSFPQTFEPFPLVSHITIVPPSTSKSLVPQDEITNLIITPGLAFGSGLHDTTRLVARALWHLEPPPASLLDLGTGSGILALLAKKMKISKVEAVEVDEEAVRNARQNFLLNGHEEIPILRSLQETNKKYEVILANILSNTLLHLKSEIVAHLQPRARLILSGITIDEAEEMIEAFRDFRLLQRNDTEDWTCLTLELPD